MRTQGTDTRKCMSDGTWSGQDLKCKGEILQIMIHLTLFTSFFAHQIRISGFYPGIENLTYVILNMQSRVHCLLVVMELTHMVVKWRHC